MWPKNKKEQNSWQLKVEDYEQDIQLLREERDELKAWCQELESRQRQQIFNRRVFEFWEQSNTRLRELKSSSCKLTQSLQQTSEEFLLQQKLYRDQKKQLLDYIDGFSESYHNVDESYQQLLQIQLHTDKIAQGAGVVGELSERLRLLSLNVAIESVHLDKPKLSDSLIASLREMSGSSRQASEEIAALSERIKSDGRLGENYFNTITEGFIGFSQAISPLLKTADQCGDMVSVFTTAVGEWVADDLLKTLKTEHLLWMSGVYSRLIGMSSVAPESGDTLQVLLEAPGIKSQSLQRVEKIHAACLRLGTALLHNCDEADSKVLLARLEELQAESTLLLGALDELHHDIQG